MLGSGSATSHSIMHNEPRYSRSPGRLPFVGGWASWASHTGHRLNPVPRKNRARQLAHRSLVARRDRALCMMDGWMWMGGWIGGLDDWLGCSLACLSQIPCPPPPPPPSLAGVTGKRREKEIQSTLRQSPGSNTWVFPKIRAPLGNGRLFHLA